MQGVRLRRLRQGGAQFTLSLPETAPFLKTKK